MQRIGWACSTFLFLQILTSQQLLAADIEAVAGEPFGIARITIPLDPTSDQTATHTNGYTLTEAKGRTYYPAFGTRRALGVLRELVGVRGPGPRNSVTAYFLFTGLEPLDVTIGTPAPHRFVISPNGRPRAYDRLLKRWWRQYNTMARMQQRTSDYPPILETYLTSMLGWRLGLPAPRIGRIESETTTIQQQSLKLVLNVESMRIDAMQRTLTGVDQHSSIADQPVPEPIQWNQPPVALPTNLPTIEPIARRVPEECFYIRFGNFPNYLWLRHLLEENGGSIGRMVALRGHDALLGQRSQQQLGLKESKLAEILGPKLISDVAMIGRDTYLREGAAIGILFEAKNDLLKSDLMKQRQNAVNIWKDRGAVLEQVNIDGTKVSVARTPDNRLRSFYVIDDNYHLVTNSRYIVRQFLSTRGGSGSLAESPEFQLARAEKPLDENAAVFAYLSPAFFRGLVTPQYQIELRRRLKAITDIELVQMASLAARNEGKPGETIDDFIAHGFLPRHFNSRVDQSNVVIQGETFLDSVRGARGSFLPIPDVPVDGVSHEEAATYAQIANFHRQFWDHMDPIIVQVQRFALPEPDRERVQIRADMVPFNREKYGKIASIVGPPSPVRIRQYPDEIVSAQMTLQGGRMMSGVGTHHMFLGVLDREIDYQFAPAPLIRALQVLRTAPAYLGSWPKLGLLDMLPLSRLRPVDQEGYSRHLFGLWRRQTPDGFSMVSFDPSILETVAPHLGVDEVEEEAQVRLHVGDLSQSKLRRWFASIDFQRAYETSIGNTRFLHQLSQQLGVPKSNALDMAESLLGVQLVCSLGGEYALQSKPVGGESWTSTHWPDADTAGEDFQSPLMVWFRGLDARVKMHDDRLSATAAIDIQHAESEETTVPFFDLFRTPKKSLPIDSKTNDEPTVEEIPPPRPTPIP